MTKKRLVFGLLWEDGYFVLSRNFRRQVIGDLQWLDDTYGFQRIAQAVDELVLLDVSDDPSSHDAFLRDCEQLASEFFAPIAIGGHVCSVDDARAVLNVGAEKVVVNSLLFENTSVVSDIVSRFGVQSVVASIDVIRASDGSGYQVLRRSGPNRSFLALSDHLTRVLEIGVGELLLCSIDQDGTGMGFDMALMDLLPSDLRIPVVLIGGAGSATHLAKPLLDPRVSGVATANLLNFVGDGLAVARKDLNAIGLELASWPALEEVTHDR